MLQRKMGGIGSFIRKYRRGRWVMIGQGVDGIGALVRRYRSWEWEMLGQEIVEYGSFVRRKKSGEWAEAELLYEGNGTEDGRERIVCTKEMGRRMGGNESFVQCCLRKVYRLSENTL